MLISGRKTRGYDKYSPLLYIPPCFIYLDRCNQTLDPWSRSPPEAPSTTSSSPLTRSSLEVPRQEALTFRSVSLMLFVLAFLRQNLTNYVCTQILWLCLIFFLIPGGAPPFS